MPHHIQHHNTQDIFKNTRRDLIAPVVAVFILSILIIFGLSVFSVRSLDKISEEQSVHLAKSIFSDIERKLTDLAFEYAYWDQAVDNLVYHLDPVWGDENIGEYLQEIYGIDTSFVINKNREIVYLAIDGERIDDTSDFQMVDSLKTLIARARTAAPQDKEPIPVIGYIRHDGRLFYSSAALLTTYKTVDEKEIITSTDSVLVIMQEISGELLTSLAERYLLTGLHVDFSSEPQSQTATLDIEDIDGISLGVFRWSPASPGGEVLRWLLPAAIIIFLGLGALIYLSIHRATQASHAFIDALIGRHEAELERQLGHVQKMQAIGVMVGGVAHNFNNLLQPILMLSLTMRKRATLESRDRDDLNVIIQACERAIDLVNQISDFAHTKDVDHAQCCNVYEAVEQGCKLAASTIPSSITMRSMLDKNTGEVLVDTVELQTVMMNLISNAVDAMSGHIGELTIALSPVRIDGTSDTSPENIKEGAYAKLTIHDTGVGMTPETLKRIYDPFFTTKGIGNGMGLGLSSTYGIVTRHGGSIVASSTPRKGTTFNVYIPLVETGECPPQNRQENE